MRISLTKKCNLDTVACPYSHWLCWHGVDNSQLFRSHYMSVQHRLRRDRVGKVIDYVDAMSVWSLSLLCDHCQYRIHWFKIWQFEKYLAPLYVLNLQKTKFFFFPQSFKIKPMLRTRIQIFCWHPFCSGSFSWLLIRPDPNFFCWLRIRERNSDFATAMTLHITTQRHFLNVYKELFDDFWDPFQTISIDPNPDPRW